MTFHAGNGVTLTKEEENLPEEEKQKLIRQKEEQLNYERHVDDDLKDMVGRGDAAALEDESAKMDQKLGGAKDYGLGDVDGGKAQEAVDLVKKMRDEDIDEAMRLVGGGKSEAAKKQQKTNGASAQQTEYGQGAFGTLKNEDFTQYRKDKAARQAATREARRASDEAMAAKRKELLASGEYFDNGRGQILRKKQYRQYLADDQRHRHLRTAADNGAGMAAIREAGQAAWDEALARQNNEQTEVAVNYSRSAIQANRLAAEERNAAKAEAAATSAKAKLSVFDGFAAALDALNADAANAEDNIVSVWGGKDEKGRDARWTYDEQGRVTGQADARQVVRGKKLASGGVQQTEGNFRKGFVDPVVLKAINSQLQKRGADYAVTGIMARQAYGAIGKPIEGSKPMFYIQGLRNDGTQFGQYMTIDDVYRWGVENYRAANGNLGNPQKFAAEALGGYDPEGVLGMSEKERIAMMNNKTKMEIEEIKLAQKLGQDSLNAAQKYALSHYKDFIGYRKATKDDVAAGRAKKIGEPAFAVDEDVANGLASEIGDPLKMSNEDGFNAAVDFYNRMIQNQDPALGGGQTATTPSFDESRYPNATKAAMARANANPPAAPAAGGEAAPAQTATPSPSATATPPAEGQGELDFGGAEPEAATAATQITTQTSTSDEEDERKRRQAEKPKSNSWKNSALFK